MQTTNAIGQRRHNLAVLARAIWKNPGISRRELVDQFEIDESSISRLVTQLISSGLVESTGTIEGGSTPGAAPGGRRRIALKIRQDFGQVWGLALWRDRIRITITDTAGQTLVAHEEHLGPHDGNWGRYLNHAVGLATDLAAHQAPQLPVLGIGFGMPGWVDSDSGVIVRSDEFGLVETPCPREWPDHLPVLWENDANCGAWSGLGRGRPNNDELYVLARFLENGPLGLPNELSIGFGLIVNGQLHRGWRHNAGEFLSAFWDTHNVSAYGTPDQVYGRSKDDPAAFQATVTEILRNLRFASQLLDPRTIHLGGDLKERHAEVLAACERLAWTAAKDLLHPLPTGVDEVSLGAAQLVLDELFQIPSRNLRTLFRGYGTGVNDPLWKGIPADRISSAGFCSETLPCK